MSETDMAKIARLVADPHAEAIAAKDAEIAALRAAVEMAMPYLPESVVSVWEGKVSNPRDAARAALEMSGGVR